MCGIVAAMAAQNVVPTLIGGLKQLEYRGYDSSGLALHLGERIQRIRAVGRVSELEQLSLGGAGTLGVAHTRWATHGSVTQDNAHPHLSEGSGLAICLVHNGIIENHQELRIELQAKGYEFQSQTDTEVVAHLLHEARLKSIDLLEAFRAIRPRLKGAYAIAALSSQDPQSLVAARWGAPLLIGHGQVSTECFLASDASALIARTKRLSYLEDGDLVCLQRDPHTQSIAIHIEDQSGQVVAREPIESELTVDDVSLGPYAHFMQKEIAEQPGAVAATLEMVTSAQSLSPNLFGSDAQAIFSEVRQVLVLACGTSLHAGMVARYWIEAIAKIPCTVEVASEYRYRQSVVVPQTLVVVISQSGETADTLAALHHAKALGHENSLAICNVPESSLIRVARLRFLTRAGPEIGVASTKAFTTQLAALFLMALALAKSQSRLNADEEQQHLSALRHLPAALASILRSEKAFSDWAPRFVQKAHALFLGRGTHAPIAMEGALKLKEISYIHAEAYPAGELKHGPLALVDSEMPVVAIAPNDQLLEKLKSNLEEVRARGGELFVIADQGSGFQSSEGIHVIELGDHAGLLSPILHVLPLQLLAYHVALARGHDVDKPRNLAKSVTVE